MRGAILGGYLYILMANRQVDIYKLFLFKDYWNIYRYIYMEEYLVSDKEELLTQDYQKASLSLVWHRNDKRRTIVFALIELLPKEFPTPITINEIPQKISEKGYNKQAFYYQKFVDNINNILNFYKSIQNGKNIEYDKKVFEQQNYQEDVKFPNLLLSNNLPFVYGYEKCVRHNSLFNCDFQTDIKKLIFKDKYKNFINENINFDITKNIKYIGSINLVAYNPIIRDIKVHLNNDKDNNEKVFVEIEPREGVSLKNLNYIHIEKRLTGYTNYKKIEIKDNSFTISANNDVESIAHAIVCQKRGLLEWSNFYGFARAISFNMNIVNGEKVINVPSKDLKTSKDKTYKTEIVGSAIESRIEDENPPKKLREYLLECNKFEVSQKEKDNRIQKLFYDNPEEAISFVKSLIANAHKKVIIIDPYFGVKDLFEFAFSIKNSQIPVEIITSFASTSLNKSLNFAKILKKNIDKNKNINNINAYIMLGDKPAFHDRFIIVDDNVWLSGNSLADIGKRASILVQLRYPRQILNIYDLIINDKNKCLLLEEWLNDKEKTKN